MTVHLRPSRALFRFSGPDAQKLLFDVVTGRTIAEEGPAVWWALLTPQGKIQAEGLSAWRDGAFWLDVERSAADDFFRRMRMYKLRANVEIADLRETHVVGWDSDPAAGDADPRGLGARAIAVGDPGWPEDETAFISARIAAGVAELGPDFAPDTTFPHDIGMDLLGGVDFKKGCYIGQEVVSRMQHRGTARRRPVIVSGLPPAAAAGTPVIAGGREAGVIGQPVGGRAIAILRLDRIENPADVTVGDEGVALALPSWATYAFGESAAAG